LLFLVCGGFRRREDREAGATQWISGSSSLVMMVQLYTVTHLLLYVNLHTQLLHQNTSARAVITFPMLLYVLVEVFVFAGPKQAAGGKN
jgi:heme A synthase